MGKHTRAHTRTHIHCFDGQATISARKDGRRTKVPFSAKLKLRLMLPVTSIRKFRRISGSFVVSETEPDFAARTTVKMFPLKHLSQKLLRSK